MDEEVSEYKPITGELRERIGQAEHIVPIGGDSKDTQVRINLAWLTDKLDAIDSIHARLERENADLRMKFVNVNRHAQHVERENESLKAELDRVLGEHGNRDGLLQLPLDADRVPIFIGDVMESDYITRTEVAAVGIKCFFAWSNIDRRWHQYETNQFRHHAPDTWESVIYDAMQAGRTDATVDVTPLIERCKALCERTKEAGE